MHQLVLPISAGFQTDHINGNGLDNRRCNLRVATARQNQQNGRKRVSMGGHVTSSHYKGVHWHKRDRRWHVRIRDNNGHRVWLGAFNSEDSAGDAYKKAALKIHGEFARV
jgi:AP2 domain-containing protein/HNH endonuclease